VTASGLASYQVAFDELAESSRLRSLVPRQGLDFTSNHYLGLAASPRLGRAPVRGACEEQGVLAA